MKPQHQTSIPRQISKGILFPEEMIREDRDREIYHGPIPPRKPTKEAIAKAQFKDKTYRWNGR